MEERKAIRRPQITWLIIGAAVVLILQPLNYFRIQTMNWCSRRGALMQVRRCVDEEAEATGYFPTDLAEVVNRRGPGELLGIDIRELTYLAAGKPYTQRWDERIFYDRRLSRNGFESGWFDFYEGRWYFRPGYPTGDPLPPP